VALPRSAEDIEAALAVRARGGFPIIARRRRELAERTDAGEAVVMDTSRYMNEVLELDPIAGTVSVSRGSCSTS